MCVCVCVCVLSLLPPHHDIMSHEETLLHGRTVVWEMFLHSQGDVKVHEVFVCSVNTDIHRVLQLNSGVPREAVSPASDIGVWIHLPSQKCLVVGSLNLVCIWCAVPPCRCVQLEQFRTSPLV